MDELPVADPLASCLPPTGAFVSGTVRALLEMANLAVLKDSRFLLLVCSVSLPDRELGGSPAPDKRPQDTLRQILCLRPNCSGGRPASRASL